MKKICLVASLFLVFAWTMNISGQEDKAKLRYTSPATQWESEALPLGNGKLGCMVFGDVETDVIQINEHSLWSGGPGKNSNYNGGHLRRAEENHNDLQKLRTALQEKMTAFSESSAAYINASGNVVAKNYPGESEELRGYIENLMGTKTDFGSYQALSNLNMAYTSPLPDYSNYSRELDIDEAVCKVTYSQSGINYTREYFISHPDNVIVIRLSADRTGSISRKFYCYVNYDMT